MKKRICGAMILVLLLCRLNDVYVEAAESEDDYIEKYENAIDVYFSTDYDEQLLNDSQYSYHIFYDQSKSDSFSAKLFRSKLKLSDMLIDTGTAPDMAKYTEVLATILATYDLDNAEKVKAQNSFDNMKSVTDYAVDIMEIGANAFSVYTANNPDASDLQKILSKCIDGIKTTAVNANETMETLSTLKTLVQDYSKYDFLLNEIENHSEGELKNAAMHMRSYLHTQMNCILEAFLDSSASVDRNLSEFFFDDFYTDMVRAIGVYNGDSAIMSALDFIDNFFILKNSWDLGKGLGKLYGNAVIGGENLINRYHEITALIEIEDILTSRIRDYTDEYNTAEATDEKMDAASNMITLSKVLTGSRIRGEYCMYSIIESDAGAVSWFRRFIKKVTNNKETEEDIYYKQVTENLINASITLDNTQTFLDEARYYENEKAQVDNNAVLNNPLGLHTLAAGFDSGVAAIRKDGTVQFEALASFVGSYDEVNSWENVVSIAYGYKYIVALTEEGTLRVAVSSDGLVTDYGQCNIEDWKDIRQVAAGMFHTVGLKSDGTVVATGKNEDGQCNVENWTDIIMIAAGDDHTVGLKADGTVVATGDSTGSYYNPDAVGDWTDIIQITAGCSFTAGLCKDGTIRITKIDAQGYYPYGKPEDWTDVISLAAGGSSSHLLALKSDGSVIGIGPSDHGLGSEFFDVEKWNDIVLLACARGTSLGIKEDGTVLVAGMWEDSTMKELKDIRIYGID